MREIRKSTTYDYGDHIETNYFLSDKTMSIKTSPEGKLLEQVETIINKSFTASEKGVYKVCYYVKDSSGNTTFVSYEINVE